MAFITSFNFGSTFLCKEVCSRLAPTATTNPLITISFGIRQTGRRTYSKLCVSQSVSGNGILKVFQRNAVVPSGIGVKLGAVSSCSVTTNTSFTSQPVFSNRILRMFSSTSVSDAPKPNVSQNSPKESTADKSEPDSETVSSTSSSTTPPPPPKALSSKDKLKQAVRDYGATVIVFHVTMSLMSLGFFYLLVQSGLDVVSIMAKVGISESIIQSKITEEAGKFVVAYAVHKVFAPLRIAVTLTATPFIVRKLRGMGILKQMAKTKTQ